MNILLTLVKVSTNAYFLIALLLVLFFSFVFIKIFTNFEPVITPTPKFYVGDIVVFKGFSDMGDSIVIDNYCSPGRTACSPFVMFSNKDKIYVNPDLIELKRENYEDEQAD